MLGAEPVADEGVPTTQPAPFTLKSAAVRSVSVSVLERVKLRVSALFGVLGEVKLRVGGPVSRTAACEEKAVAGPTLEGCPARFVEFSRRRITMLPSEQLSADTTKLVPELAFTDAVHPVAVLPAKSKSAADSPSTELAKTRLNATGDVLT